MFGQARYAPGGMLGPRIQTDYQLVAVVRGDARIRGDGHDYRVPAGHVVLLRPGFTEMFWFAADRETLHTWCAIPATLAHGVAQASPEDQARLQARLAGPHGVQPLSERVAKLIEVALGIEEAEDAATLAFLDHLGQTALLAFLMEGSRARARRREPEPLQRARAYLESHLGQPLSVAQLADAATVSTPHLIRLWKQHYGSTPARDIWRIRTERGMDMLRETGLPVADIAERTGFRTPYHFSRLVREASGLSPRALRRAAWHGTDALSTDFEGPIDEVE